jgi:hypothetical protein
MVTAAKLDKSVSSGKRRASLSVVVLAEPRLGKFQYRHPLLAGAKDDGRKRNYEQNGNRERDVVNDWLKCYNGCAFFVGDDWAPLLDQDVDDGASALKACRLPFVVRQIKTVDEIRFGNVKACAKPVAETKSGRTFDLESLDCTATSYRARITVKGEGVSCWNAGGGNVFEHRIERGGKVLQKGEVNGYCNLLDVQKADEGIVMVFGQGSDFYPRGQFEDVITDGDFREDFDVVLTAPGETLERALEFGFKEVPLPK